MSETTSMEKQEPRIDTYIKANEKLMTTLRNIKSIKDRIMETGGIPSPKDTAEMLLLTSSLYDDMMTLAGKYRAMRDELMSEYISAGEAASKADALSKGSEFGQMYSYISNRSEALIEINNSLKKVQDYHQETAKNNY